MKKNILDFIDSGRENGLLLVDPNTGSGKTFWSCQAIHDYARNPNNKKKIFFTTTLLKNLPEDELKKAYNNEVLYKKEVLVIKSNVDFVKENITRVKVPEEFQGDEYQALYHLVEACTEPNYGKTPGIYREEMDKRLSEAEVVFRKYLRKIITTQMKGSEQEKKDNIRHNSKYRWIGEIYPTVFTDDFKIYLLSISKFLRRNDTLVKPSYPFISADVLKNSIVFIDEFDASKDTIQEFIIEKAVESQNDYLDMVKELHGRMRDYRPASSFYGPYEKYVENKPYLRTLKTLQKEVEGLYEKYALYFNYKTNDGFDRSRSFLFFDGAFRSYLSNNNHYIRCVKDGDNQQVKIYYENKDVYEKNRDLDNDINIYSLLRDVTHFLNEFARFIANWAERYAVAENIKRKNQNAVLESYTVEDAVDTICDAYFRSKHLNNIFHDLITSSSIRNIRDEETVIDDFSFFNRGFKFFEFVDGDKHNEETKINFIQIDETPEKILLFLAKNTKVIGLSATGRINSVLSNYSQKYLRNELKDSLLTLTEDTYESLKKSQEEKWSPYQDGSIKVNIESVDRGEENKSIQERLKQITQNKDLERNFSRMLENLDIQQSNKEYYQKRYCNIFAVLKNFIDNENVESLLCLNMALPKRNLATFDLGVFERFVEQYCKVYGKSSPKIKVLKSGSDFEDEKDLLLKELANGEKVFVFSAYKTIGAGQNLQYKIPQRDIDSESIVQIGRKQDVKDFDAIYLGDVTNVVTNINDVKKIGMKELLEFLFEIKYLYENNEISPRDLNQLVQAGFKAYTNKNDYNAPMEVVRHSTSVRRKMTRDVIQAVGRLCRTNNKKKDIFIYTNNALLATLDVASVRVDLMNPELKKLFEIAANFAQSLPEEKSLVENEANRKSESANSYIQGMLRHDWTLKSMRLWTELRECTLRHPTAPSNLAEKDHILGDYYIQNFENRSNYYYAQKGDFSGIIVNLFKDRSDFEKGLDEEYARNIGHVSGKSARLQQFFLYSGMKKHFEKMHYATEFGKDDLILSPVLFNNIYKGALGEIAGRFILEQELNLTLKEIEDPANFEFFDFMLIDGVYVDFKHWKRTVAKSTERFHSEIEKKLNTIGAKKAYVINIIKEGESVISSDKDGKIIEIPWLIDEKGMPNESAIKMLIEEVHNGK